MGCWWAKWFHYVRWRRRWKLAQPEGTRIDLIMIINIRITLCKCIRLFPFKITLVLRRRRCMGKALFSSSTEAYFNHPDITARWLVHLGLKNFTNPMVVASEPMAIQPAKTGGASGYIISWTSHLNSDFFSSAANSLLRWHQDLPLKAPLQPDRTSCSYRLADSVIPCSYPVRSK